MGRQGGRRLLGTGSGQEKEAGKLWPVGSSRQEMAGKTEQV